MRRYIPEDTHLKSHNELPAWTLPWVSSVLSIRHNLFL
jgi:hypothetical protein